jgi:hypothetical protein
MRFALILETGDTRLPNDWLQRKRQDLDKRAGDSARRKMFESNAMDSVPAMFQGLEDRVREDIDEYERQFGKTLTLSRKENTSFTVSDSQDWRTMNSVSASISGRGTVIAIKHATGTNTKLDDKIDVAADEVGVVRFRHKERFLSDVSEASQIVLERIVDLGCRQ